MVEGAVFTDNTKIGVTLHGDQALFFHPRCVVLYFFAVLLQQLVWRVGVGVVYWEKGQLCRLTKL